MTRALEVAKEFVICCYGACREAERSADAALHSPWSEFRAYYGECKTARLEVLLTHLGKKLPKQAADQAPPSTEEALRDLPGPVGNLFRRLCANWRRAFPFRVHEVRFLVNSLQKFLDLVGERQKPEQQALIAVRMAMYDCQRLIEGRCPGLQELKKAAWVEHFNQPKHLMFVKLEDLVSGEVVEEMHGTRGWQNTGASGRSST